SDVDEAGVTRWQRMAASYSAAKKLVSRLTTSLSSAVWTVHWRARSIVRSAPAGGPMSTMKRALALGPMGCAGSLVGLPEAVIIGRQKYLPSVVSSGRINLCASQVTGATRGEQ